MSNGTLTIPTFDTERLLLRGVSLDDIPSYEKYFIDYEVIGQLAAAVPWPYPKDGVKDFLENLIFPNQGKTQWMWGIFEKKNPFILIGVIHLWKVGRPEHRGFWLGKPFWGMGYMTEAVNPIIDFAFNELNFEKLIFANAVGNLKSRRVKEKTGATLIDIKPAQFVNPNYNEHEIWELTKGNWKNHKKINRLSEWPSVYSKFVNHFSNFKESGPFDIGSAIPFSRLGIQVLKIPQKSTIKIPSNGANGSPLGYVNSSNAGISLDDSNAKTELTELFLFVLKGSSQLKIYNGPKPLCERLANEKGALGLTEGSWTDISASNDSKEEVLLLLVTAKSQANENQSKNSQSKISQNALPEIINCPAESMRIPFHYPGDSETFGVGFRISDKVNLKKLGIWYEVLPPNTRASYPHAHTHEEEFCFIVNGNANWPN